MSESVSDDISMMSSQWSSSRSTNSYLPRPRTISNDSTHNNLLNSPNGSIRSTCSVSSNSTASFNSQPPRFPPLKTTQQSSMRKEEESSSTKILHQLEKKLQQNINMKGGDLEARVLIYNQIGNIYFRQGQLDRAASYYSLAIQSSASGATLATSYLNLGTVCWRNGNITDAIRYLETSLECEQHEDAIKHNKINTTTIAMVHHQLGLCYALTKNFVLAHESLNRALNIRMNMNSEVDVDVDVARTIDALGRIFFLEMKYDYSIYHHRRALQIYQKLRISDTTTILQNLENAYQARDSNVTNLDAITEVTPCRTTTMESNYMLRESINEMEGTMQRISIEKVNMLSSPIVEGEPFADSPSSMMT